MKNTLSTIAWYVMTLAFICQIATNYLLNEKLDRLEVKIEILEFKEEMVVDNVIDEVFRILTEMLTPPTEIQKMERDIQQSI